MMQLSNHHAHGIEEGACSLSEVVGLCEQYFGVRRQGNPDFHVQAFELFGVDDARELARRALGHSFTKGPKIFVISFVSTTHETQNALLKLFEDPPAQTFFVLRVPSFELLLPTLRSRLMLMRGTDVYEKSQTSSFLKRTPVERLKVVKEILDKKSKTDALKLLNEIERELYTDGLMKNRRVLGELMRVRRYINNRGASPKLLLEHLVLSI